MTDPVSLGLGTAAEELRMLQRGWARTHGKSFDDSDRVHSLEDNLFRPMNPATRSEFEAGDGSELGTTHTPGSMYSLISSSALCCNMFDIWRGQPLADLAAGLALDPSYGVAGFEAKHPTGLLGNAPNLDVELAAPGLPPVAIESKFVETYRRVTNLFKPSYFGDQATWDGLEDWRRTAVAIDQGRLTFVTLNAAQLIKHALGLSRRYGADGFVLLYLWYRVRGPAGDEHQTEVERFRMEVGHTIDFRTATTPDVLSKVKVGPPGWLDYMTERYVPV